MQRRYDLDPDDVPVYVAEMPGAKDIIAALAEHKRGLVEQVKGIVDGVERHSRDPLASEHRKVETIERHIADAGAFLATALDHAERIGLERERTTASRQRFSHILGGSDMQDTRTTEFEEFLRFGGQPYFDVPLVERHDLTKGTSTAGAELIPTGFVRELFVALRAAAGVRQTNARVIRTTGGENMLVPKTTSQGTAAIVAEAGPIAEADPAFSQVTVGAYKYAQLLQVSRELLEDSAVDILSYLGEMFGEAIGYANGAHMVTGTGTGQPQGIANSPQAGVTGGAGTGTSVTGDNLISLFFSVLPQYRRNGYWIANDTTWAAVRALKASGTGDYLFREGVAGTGELPTILGRPVVSDPTMPAMAINAYSIAFGDFSRYYIIRDVDGVRVERSDDFAFANDLVTFRSIFRTDGRQVLNGANGAVKFYRNGAS